jgi:threonine synthase
MAGGSLIGKIHKAFQELQQLGWVSPSPYRVHGAQASGCAPISTAVKNGWDSHKPVKNPQTIARSLAIGDPADGYFAIRVIRETGGWADDASDAEIAESMALLAETEGIFTETAGGVTLAVARKLIEQGRISPDDEIVLCITGNGLKTQEALNGVLTEAPVIPPRLEEFDRLLAGSLTTSAPQVTHELAPAGA